MPKSSLFSGLMHRASSAVDLILYVQPSVCFSSLYGDRLFYASLLLFSGPRAVLFLIETSLSLQIWINLHGEVLGFSFNETKNHTDMDEVDFHVMAIQGPVLSFCSIKLLGECLYHRSGYGGVFETLICRVTIVKHPFFSDQWE